MLVAQSQLNPSAVLDEIASCIPTDVQQMFVAAAYVTREGSELLFGRLRTHLGVGAFNRLPKRLVTTGDYGLTDPDALVEWLRLGAQVELANGVDILRNSLIPAVAFHPKVFAFKSSTGDWHAVCGSANLTGRGMTINTEAVTTTHLSDAAMTIAIASVSQGALVVTSALISAYRALRRAAPPPPVMAQDVGGPPPAPAAPSNLAIFGDAVAAGMVNPRSFDRFWVQTRGMSGGSGTQVELPRRANEFFGFHFTQHIAGNVVLIGRPVLLAGRRRWADRKLTWHGDNHMERINMPSAAIGGYSYVHSAVCFRRRGSGYEFRQRAVEF